MMRAGALVGLVMVVGLASACNPDKPGGKPPQLEASGGLAATTVLAASSAPPPAVSPAAPSSAPPAASAPPPVLDYSATITVPSTIKPGEKRPFVLYLHGLGASGRVLLGALGIPALAAERRFVYAAPDGSFDSKKQRFWNASKACCNLDKIEVDHVAALRALIQQAAARPEVDPRRIYVVGTSNGAFMAHRLACEVSEIAAIAALSGMGPADGETCTPTGLVAVLQVHGDADDVIPYEGGSALKRPTLPRHPSALDSVTAWAGRDGCGRKPTAAGALDLDEKLEGPESAVLRFPGCKAPVELWTVHGGSHFIGMNHKAQGLVLDFLEKQRKPLSSQPRR